jgi:isopentenyl-diphosphate delta-isomerase
VAEQTIRNDVVSFDSEELILVDDQDREIGFLDKARAHQGEAVLHRAFSLFIFNGRGELLLQKRADGKRLWAGFWSNSCCSHPRRGETMPVATQRRLRQELGIETALEYVYKFQYHAQFDASGAERELCWVYLGQSNDLPRINALEISDWRYVPAAQLEKEFSEHPEAFTPWFKLEWQRLNTEFRPLLERYLRGEGGRADAAAGGVG